jgi:hypothetical protein
MKFFDKVTEMLRIIITQYFMKTRLTQQIVLNSDQGNNPVLKGHHLAQIFFFKKNETTL